MSRADTREPKTRTAPLIRAGWQLATLHHGDYDGHDAVGKLWAIEQKTIEKLVADMRSGTLIKQCRALVEHSDFPILMVQGHWTQQDGSLLGSGITWEQAWNQLQTIQDMGCRLQLTSSDSHTVERLFELESYYKKEQHPSALRQLSGNPTIIALCLIEGIGEEKAKALEKVFGTLGSIAENAISGDIWRTPGVGEVLAQRIHNFFWEAK